MKTFSALVAAALSVSAHAQITLPSVLADHMVLQRDMMVPIWGRAKAGQAVTVTVLDGAGHQVSSAQAQSASDGKFSVKLPSMQATSQPLKIRVTCAGETIERTDVLVGEVWLCGGQSNMEFNVGASTGGDSFARTLPSTVRCFTAPHEMAAHPTEDLPAQWVVANPQAALGFTAVGSWFAAKVGSTLNVPVGILSINWGGSPGEAWMPIDHAQSHPMFAARAADQQSAGRIFENLSPAQLQSVNEGASAEYRSAVAAYWKNLQGSDAGFEGQWATQPVIDADGWRKAQVPGVFGAATAGTESLADFDGGSWWRKSVTLPTTWAGRDVQLKLGAIDDSDIVWINGIESGRTTGLWNHSRIYSIPGTAIRGGVNELSVFLLDTSGAGGFTGDAKAMVIQLASTDGVPAADTAPIAVAGEWSWKRGNAFTAQAPNPPGKPVHPQARWESFGSMWNGMMTPVIPYGIRGALWYQGESNANRADQYRELLPAMIRGWRAKWGEGDFPFGIVQLAGFRAASDNPVEGEWSDLRDAQLNTAQTVANCGLAVTIDVGEANDIHPRNKKAVADRLAAWALSQVYARGGEWSGPMYQSSLARGSTMVVSFDHAQGLATVGGAKVDGFAIAGADGKFEWADAKIDGTTVVVSSSRVSAPVVVRYAWSSNPVRANLINAVGFPASPFASDRPRTMPMQ